MGHMPKPHYIAKRGYWVCRVNKKQRYLGKNRKRAFEKFYRIMLAAGRVGDPQSVAGAIGAWCAEHGGDWERERLQVWAKFDGPRLLCDLPPDRLERYAAHLGRRGNAPQTIRHNVRLARTVWAWAAQKGWADAPPPPMPKLPKSQRNPKDIPPDQLPVVLARIERVRKARPLILFILATGCRPKEARLLRWDEVDLARGVCVIPGHKTAGRTGKPRTIYLTEHAKTILDAHPRVTEYVFPSGTGKPYTKGGLRSILCRVGLTGPYQLRHTFAQYALEQTTIEDVAKLLGHSDLRMVQVYAQVRDQRARKVAQGLTPPSQVPPAPPEPSRDGASASHRKRPRNQGKSRRTPGTGTDG